MGLQDETPGEDAAASAHPNTVERDTDDHAVALRELIQALDEFTDYWGPSPDPDAEFAAIEGSNPLRQALRSVWRHYSRRGPPRVARKAAWGLLRASRKCGATMVRVNEALDCVEQLNEWSHAELARIEPTSTASVRDGLGEEFPFREALTCVCAALASYVVEGHSASEQMTLRSEPPELEAIAPGHHVHAAVKHLESYYGGSLPSEGCRIWTQLLESSRQERPEDDAECLALHDKTYDAAIELWRWVGDILSESSGSAVADAFCDDVGVPRSVLAGMPPGSTATEWAEKANEWLKSRGRGLITMQGLPKPPKERPSWDTPEKLLEQCQTLRNAWVLSNDDGLWKAFLVPRVRESWIAMRLVGGSVPAEPTEFGTLEECMRAIDEVIRWCEKRLDVSPARADPSSAQKSPRPKTYLLNWREILETLSLKNDEETREKVRRLNEMHNGPIVVGGRGQQPKAEKGKLLDWWNDLERRFEKVEQRNRDKQATTESQYKHGRGEIVVPDLRGHVKKRRRN